MRLATLEDGGKAAIVEDEWLLDLETLGAQADLQAAARQSVRGLLEADPSALERLRTVLAKGGAEHRIGPLADHRLGPPIPDPEKIVCVGLNYAEHVVETQRADPGHATLFAKFRNSLAGPADPIPLPAASKQVDYEGEIAVVIGRRGKMIPARDALGHVAGAMAFNDVTARDLQYRSTQWLAGKAVDGFGPCGPTLVTLDELGDLRTLRIQTRVNGVTVQDAPATMMLRGVPELIAEISESMTLEPGDIICTGTPGGVGSRREPPLWLRDGDLVEVEVDRIGTLVNPVAG